MIILDAFFALFIFVTVILPFYIMWLVVGLIKPRTREGVKITNSLIGKLVVVLCKLSLKVVIAFAIALAWIQFLKWIIIDLLIPHFPP